MEDEVPINLNGLRYMYHETSFDNLDHDTPSPSEPGEPPLADKDNQTQAEEVDEDDDEDTKPLDYYFGDNSPATGQRDEREEMQEDNTENEPNGQPAAQEEPDEDEDVVFVEEVCKKAKLTRPQQLLADRLADRISDRLADRISDRVANAAREQIEKHLSKNAATRRRAPPTQRRPARNHSAAAPTELRLFGQAAVDHIYRNSRSPTHFATNLLVQVFRPDELLDPFVSFCGMKPGYRALDPVRIDFIRQEMERRFDVDEGLWQRCVRTIRSKIWNVRNAHRY